jgi:hypothetical protein
MTRRQNLGSFVARIWLEHGTNGNPIWRGHVRHVQGEQETHLQSLGEMSDFLARVSRIPDSGASGLRPGEHARCAGRDLRL